MNSAGQFVLAIKAAGPRRNIIDEMWDAFRVPQALGAAKVPLPVPDVAPPFHTADELAAMWPLVCRGILGRKRAARYHPDALARDLERAGLPIVVNTDGKPGHIIAGRRRLYYWTVHRPAATMLSDSDVREILRYCLPAAHNKE
jgi:hypothetical protein